MRRCGWRILGLYINFFVSPLFQHPQVLYLIFSQFFSSASVFFSCASAFFSFAFAFFRSASAAITAPGESSASSACLRVSASSVCLRVTVTASSVCLRVPSPPPPRQCLHSLLRVTPFKGLDFTNFLFRLLSCGCWYMLLVWIIECWLMVYMLLFGLLSVTQSHAWKQINWLELILSFFTKIDITS